MKHKCSIPWFVFNNRTTDPKPVSVIRERRAIVITICFMVMLVGLLALAAAYNTVCFGIMVALLAVGGAGGLMRVVFLYAKGGD